MYLLGIITALREFQTRLVEHNVSVFVRRAGPNYQEGLRRMREFGGTLGIPLHVFGPETHMTAICGMALGKKPIPKNTDVHFATANFLLPGGQQQADQRKMTSSQSSQVDGNNGGEKFALLCSCACHFFLFQCYLFVLLSCKKFTFYNRHNSG
jgi:ATP citrate (pro-S)-lyase